MSMQYDPYTGQPISNPPENTPQDTPIPAEFKEVTSSEEALSSDGASTQLSPTSGESFSPEAPSVQVSPAQEDPLSAGSNPSQFSPAPENQFSSEPKKKKKRREKRPMGRGFVAVMLVFSLLLSCGAGALTGYLAGKATSSTSSSTGGTNTSITLPGGEEALSVADVAALCSNSVVAITTESVSTGQFMQQYVTTGAGSGVILSEDGYIITNNHVISGASSITVTTTDGSTYPATVVGTDSSLDIALLKIDATGLQPATLGDSDQLVVGQAAIVIGNPLGTLAGTVTNGIISALDREITLDDQTMNLLQTNAAVNPGNSGGGLFDSTGKLIGIVNAKSSGTEIEGIGFAIPINDVKDIVQQLMEKGYVDGNLKLGITMVNITDSATASQYRVDALGVYIAAVSDGSLAAKYGLQAGDRIVALNGEEIDDAQDVVSFMQHAKVNDILRMTISRDGKLETVEITITPVP